MVIIDFDDFCDNNHRLDLLWQLKQANSKFRCTVFAIPAACSPEFINDLPSWVEVAVHGAKHTTSRECENWTERQMTNCILGVESCSQRFVKGFRAPGWQISDGCYRVLAKRGWWVADKIVNNSRRPRMMYYVCGPDSWHGHIQNVCDNGLEETFDSLLEAVLDEDNFKFVSEAIREWVPE